LTQNFSKTWHFWEMNSNGKTSIHYHPTNRAYRCKRRFHIYAEQRQIGVRKGDQVTGAKRLPGPATLERGTTASL
jgi:hypothetical protein